MKAVPIHASLGDISRQSEQLRETGLRSMERRIEASDLRQIGAKCAYDADESEIVRLMKWASGINRCNSASNRSEITTGLV